MTDTQQRIFFGPNTTGPEVEKLIEAIQLEEGMIVQHASIEAAIGVEHHESRYRTIVNAWRKRLIRERGVDLHPALGLGYEVLTSARRLEIAVAKLKGSTRKDRAALHLLGRIDQERLTDEQKVTYGVAVTQTSTRVQAGTQAMKLIANATKLQPLPQRMPPGK